MGNREGISPFYLFFDSGSRFRGFEQILPDMKRIRGIEVGMEKREGTEGGRFGMVGQKPVFRASTMRHFRKLGILFGH